MKNYKLFFIILNFLLYLVILFLYLAFKDQRIFILALLGFNVFLTLFLILKNRLVLKQIIMSREFKNFLPSVFNIVLFFFVLALLNYVSFKYYKQWDFGKFKLNTLTAQSQNVVRGIQGDLHFKILSKKSDFPLWESLVELYRSHNHSITVEKIDIEARPDILAEYKLSSASSMAIHWNQKFQIVEFHDELNITNALIRLTRQIHPVVYIIEDFQTKNFYEKSSEGMSIAREILENNSLEVRPLKISQTKEIPFDASGLILWGPEYELQKIDVDVLKRYLDRGGNLLIALDPRPFQKYQEPLISLFYELGFIYHNNLVYDQKNFVNGSNGAVPIVSQMMLNPFPPFQSFAKQMGLIQGQVFFPIVSSMTFVKSKNSKSGSEIFNPILYTSDNGNSFGESSSKQVAAGNVVYNPGEDLLGPLSLGVLFQENKQRIVFLGNSTFIQNSYSKFSENIKIFLNFTYWMIGEDRLVSFDLPIIQSEKILISESEYNSIFYLSIIFIPVIFLGISIYLYFRRVYRQ